MRLRSATIEGFRGFVKKAEIDLDADVIILQGPNGVGKTSLLDAILWALTGRIDRFRDRGSPISLYAREGIARVVLVVKDGDSDFVVTRATDGDRDSIRIRSADAKLEGAAAESRLSEHLLPHLRERAQAAAALSNVLTRGVYLQQDLVRQFVESDTAAERFGLISEVIGAGIVLELQSALEKSRNQWARNTTSLRKEQLEPLLQQRSSVDEQRLRLDPEPLNETVEARVGAAQLFESAVELIGRTRISLTEAPSASSGLDRLLKEIAGERARTERELSTTRALMEETRLVSIATMPDAGAIPALQARDDELVRELADLDAAVERELAAIARLLQQRLTDQDRTNRLATMAQLALDELGDICPVCQQRHDPQATTRHLRALIAASRKAAEPVGSVESSIEGINVRRDSLRAELDTVRTRLREATAALREAEARRSVYAARLSDIGITSDEDAAGALAARATSIENRLVRVTALLRHGETLTLSIVRLGEQRRRTELLHQKIGLEPRIGALNSQIVQLDKTHSLAGRIIDGLRRASLEVTSQQIESARPLFQRIYSRIDPHPTFRLTQIITAQWSGVEACFVPASPILIKARRSATRSRTSAVLSSILSPFHFFWR